MGFFRRLFGLLVFTAATSSVIFGLVYLYYVPTLPHLHHFSDYQPKLGSRIYSADNQLIGEFALERRVPVPQHKIPPLLAHAFVAAEDKRFYHHIGIDLIGMAQAVFDKIRHPAEKLRGASTITQQVAKSLLATHESYEAATERSLSRKLREALLALHLEKALTKDQILYIYLTQTFLGHKAYGVGAAAEHYFRKNVWDLNLAEIATLAGLPQRPSDYSPLMQPRQALARRRYVLRRMREEGYITAADFKAAFSEELIVYPREELYLQMAPYYTEQVRRELIDRYGERALLEEGLEIYTSLNLEFQQMAQTALDKGLRELDKRQGYRGPLAHLEPSKWGLLIERYRQELGLAHDSTPAALRNDVTYVAVVMSFATKGEYALINVAGTVGYLPLAAMRWARAPNAMERVDLHYITDVRQALKAGDVVAVRLSSPEQLRADVHGSKGDESLPEGQLFMLSQEPLTQAALVAVDPRSGYVQVQIGGYDFDESTYNRAMQACREPGSVFKPIVYSAAIDKFDYTASTLVDDKPLVFDDPDHTTRWKPGNASERFRGRVPLRTCLKDSINTPAIRIAEAVGIDDIIKNARRLGISTPLKRELGTALGSSCTTLWDLMHVYTTINQLGVRRHLKLVRRVVDRYGTVLEDHTVAWDPTLDWVSRMDRAYRRIVTPPHEVLDAQTAFLMTSLLRNVIESGTGMAASHMGQVVAGKTGTTNDSYDAWFMGFTKNMVTGVWVGHDTNDRPLGVNEQGAKTALPLWVDFMQNALMDYTTSPPKRVVHGAFEPPAGVVQVAIDPETGLLARPNADRQVLEYYRLGTEPTDYTADKAVLNPAELDMFKADTPL